MSLLAQSLWHDHPQHYHFLDTRRMRFSRHDLPTINGFLASYRGTDGLKTGTTCDAGYNLVASAERNGLRLMQSYRKIATPLHAALAWPRCSTGDSAQPLVALATNPQGVCSRFSILGNSFVGEIDRSTERHALSWRLPVPTDSEE